MSYFGWNSRDDSYAAGRSLDASIALRQAGFNEDLIIRLNDSGYTFDEIAANFSTPVLDQTCYIDEISLGFALILKRRATKKEIEIGGE